MPVISTEKINYSHIRRELFAYNLMLLVIKILNKTSSKFTVHILGWNYLLNKK
jgi:hypothetical protein